MSQKPSAKIFETESDLLCHMLPIDQVRGDLAPGFSFAGAMGSNSCGLIGDN